MLSELKNMGLRKLSSNYIESPFAVLLRSPIFRNVSVVFSGHTVAKAIGILIAWILVRNLKPEEYGVFSIIDLVAGFSVGVLATGFNWSMIKSIAAFKHEDGKAWHVARTVLKIEFVYGLVMALAIYLSADILARSFFHKPELLPYLRLCSIGVLGSLLFNYRSSIFQAFKQFKVDAVFNIGQSTLYLIIIAFLLAKGLFNIRVISVVYVGLPLVISGFAIALLKDSFAKGKAAHIPNFISTMGTNYAWLLSYTVCLWLTSQVHLIVLTRYFPLQEIGLYGFAYKIYGISLLLMSSIKAVLLPTFSEMLDKRLLKDSFNKALKATTVISFCFFLSIPFLGLFVKLFAGTNYIRSAVMLQILIFGAATSTMFSPSSNILVSQDRFKSMAVGGLLLIAINLLGHIFVTPRYGGVGAASVQVLSHLALNSYFTFNVYRLLYAEKSF